MNTIIVPGRAEDVSDGYHTFNQLYAHRDALFVNLCLLMKDRAFKSRMQSDGLSTPGYFILGLNADSGQITYHVKDKWWDYLDIPDVEGQYDYDGYSSTDVLLRLMDMAGYDWKGRLAVYQIEGEERD